MTAYMSDQSLTTWTHCEPSVVCLKAPSRMGHTMHLASLDPPGGLPRGVLCQQQQRVSGSVHLVAL